MGINKRLKIALVRPNYHSHLITPPLGLGYLASYLKSKGYNPVIIDGLNLGYSIEKIVEACQGMDIVGINCLSDYFSEVIDLSRALKRKGLTLIIGGPHASSLPELTLEETHADYVVVGEGEEALFQLMESIERNESTENLQGIMTKDSKRIAQRPLIENLDGLPYPDWEQIDPRSYKRAPHGGLVKSFPIAPIISSRGCTFECTFCASSRLWHRKIRFRSPENVVDEIEFLVKRFKVKEIHFEDDNLTLKRQHIEDICKSILRRNLRINWATPNGIRVDTLDLELLKLMKKSGCYSIAFGIESGNQKILNNIKKHTSLETVIKAVKLAKKIGIITQGFFIFGLPGETEETIHETIDFAKRLPLDKAQFLILDVLPGSGLWDEIMRGRPAEWAHRSYQEATWVPEGIDRAVLNRAPGYAFRTFFLRPRQIFFLLRYFRFSQIPFIIRRIVDFNIISFATNRGKKRG